MTIFMPTSALQQFWLTLVCISIALTAAAVLYKYCSSAKAKTPWTKEASAISSGDQGGEETRGYSPPGSDKTAYADKYASAEAAAMPPPLEDGIVENKDAMAGSTRSVREIAQTYAANEFAQRMGITTAPPTTTIDAPVEIRATVSVRNMVMQFEREHGSFGVFDE